MIRLWKKISYFWKNNLWFSSGAVFVLVFSLHAFFYLPNVGIIFDDHFFLFKLSQLLREEGLEVIRNFRWIIFKETPHASFSLIYFFYWPFTFFADSIVGLKLADITLAALSITLLYFLLRKAKVPFSFLFLLLVFSSNPLITKVLCGRALALDGVLALLEIFFLVKKKPKVFLALSVFHFFWHPSRFFVPLLSAVIVEFIRHFILERRIFWKNLTGAFFSVLFSMGIFSLIFYNFFTAFGKVFSVLKTGLESEDIGDIQGRELSRLDFSVFFQESLLIFGLFFLAVALTGAIYWKFRRGKGFALLTERTSDQLLLLFSVFSWTGVVFAGAVLVTGRFSDFFYFAVIFLLALTMKIIFEEKMVTVEEAFVRRFLLVAVFAFLIFFSQEKLIGVNLLYAKTDVEKYQKAAEWIAENTKKGERVFLQKWDNFFLFFFFNHQNFYTMGLEPKDLYDYDSKIFWKWYNISRYGFYCDQPRDCLDQAEKYLQNLAKDDFREKNAKEIVDFIRKDMRSSVAILRSGVLFEDILKHQAEQISQSAEIKEGNLYVIVFE